MKTADSGDSNYACINVYGSGLYVEKVVVYVRSWKWFPPWPATVCDVKAEAWGNEEGQNPWSRNGRNATCNNLSTSVEFVLNKRMVPYTDICARAAAEEKAPNEPPVCLKIYP
ncbi:hypothetical protein DIZ27_12470 [Streptomyces sp. NWU339]|uniref:hypothetical protein n=1 Tax=Streptomyces sp. NWU339 TaxID=2185284 RepID=UPI000D67E450|nr:hypothetical protein [Streptomyces sp. NWU339]PWI10411.1 hypothetical protein DIZ27_12470 [Streptomyces sp. NWU339]